MAIVRTHSVQIVTEDGAYILFYSSENAAFQSFQKVRKFVLANDGSVDLSDEEDTSLIIMRATFRSAVMLPLPKAGPLEFLTRLDLTDKKAN